MMFRSSLLSILLLSLLVMSFAGCSRQDRMATHPVRGIVRYPDHKVVRHGSVEFEIMNVANPVTARGTIQPDGSFVLGTYEKDDGAVPGKHRVVVISYHAIGNGAERPGLIPETTLDPKYQSYRTTDLVHEVREGKNRVIVDVQYANTKMEKDANSTTTGTSG